MRSCVTSSIFNLLLLDFYNCKQSCATGGSGASSYLLIPPSLRIVGSHYLEVPRTLRVEKSKGMKTRNIGKSELTQSGLFRIVIEQVLYSILRTPYWVITHALRFSSLGFGGLVRRESARVRFSLVTYRRNVLYPNVSAAHEVTRYWGDGESIR